MEYLYFNVYAVHLWQTIYAHNCFSVKALKSFYNQFFNTYQYYAINVYA
jgi:hypothetical protein